MNEIVKLDNDFLMQLQEDDARLSALQDSTLAEVQQQYGCNREDARNLVKFAHKQTEADHLAYAPSGTEYLEARIDTGIRDELNALLTKQLELQVILTKSKQQGETFGQKYKQKSGPSLTGAEAQMLLDDLFKRILEIKKVLTASRPKDAAATVSIDMGGMVSTIIDNIKGEQA